MISKGAPLPSEQGAPPSRLITLFLCPVLVSIARSKLSRTFVVRRIDLSHAQSRHILRGLTPVVHIHKVVTWLIFTVVIW
eukprot:jgi/Botrbrau1/8440/Bobra.0237s0059.1